MFDAPPPTPPCPGTCLPLQKWINETESCMVREFPTPGEMKGTNAAMNSRLKKTRHHLKNGHLVSHSSFVFFKSIEERRTPRSSGGCYSAGAK